MMDSGIGQVLNTNCIVCYLLLTSQNYSLYNTTLPMLRIFFVSKEMVGTSRNSMFSCHNMLIVYMYDFPVKKEFGLRSSKNNFCLKDPSKHTYI